MSATPGELIYDLSLRALTAQRARLDNLRGRAATLLSAAGLVTSFLGAEALKDTKTVGGQSVRDTSFAGFEIVGLVAFVLLGAACVYVIWPRRDRWRFEFSAVELGIEYEHRADHDEVRRELAETFEAAHRANEPQLGTLFTMFRLASGLLLIEVVAWMIDLGW